MLVTALAKAHFWGTVREPHVELRDSLLNCSIAMNGDLVKVSESIVAGTGIEDSCFEMYFNQATSFSI